MKLRDYFLCAKNGSLHKQKHTHALWYSPEHEAKTDTEEKKLFNKVIFFSLCTKSILVAS